MKAPIESKVKAGSVAAGAAALVLWALGTYVFRGAVPDIVAGIVEAIVPAVIAGVAGYLAKHTPRTPPGQ